MKIARWLNTARIMAILYAFFVFSLGSLIYIKIQFGLYNWDLFMSGVRMALWLLFQCALGGLMIEAWRQHNIRGTLSRRVAEVVYWAPRIVWVLISLFITLIAILLSGDGYNQIDDVWMVIQGHPLVLAPLIIMGIILAVAWRWEWVGAAVIIFVTIFVLLEFLNYLFAQMLESMLFYIIPLLLLATAFWLNWRWHKEIRAARGNDFVPSAQTMS